FIPVTARLTRPAARDIAALSACLRYPRFRQWEICSIYVVEFLPLNMPVSRASANPVFPAAFHMLEKHFKHFVISAHPVILIMSQQFRSQFFVRFIHWYVHIFFAPLVNDFHFVSHGFT
ncbi:MAG: hypothetical protein JXX14_19030, partial [Deltaproteobacteria bacterium]|nr:hypothetical protein [Deltaproteobacteria bacterium]